MVHSGPLQTAVSGGLPALALQLLFLVGIGTAVAGRTRAEADGRQRLLGAAFLAAGVAYFVQDLSGWPHVALGALAFVLGGLGNRMECGKPASAPIRGTDGRSRVLACGDRRGIRLDVVRHLASASGRSG